MIECLRSRAAMAALAFVASTSALHTQPGPSAAADRARLREILQQLVEIPTTEQTGSTPRAAQAMADRLIAAGFPTQDVRVLGPDARTGTLIARARGKDRSARPVLLMSHLDVVPASAEDWTVDPWKLTERDGWFYGRGTHDNKAGTATLIANLIRLEREAWQPARDVIVLLTADEETSQASLRWLLKEHRPLIDAEMAFNIDAGGVNYRAGRPVFFEFQSSEKVYADYRLEATDPGGHSSLARPGNPIYTLSAALTRIGEHQFPVRLNDGTRLFFERAAATEQGQTAIDMRKVVEVPPDPAAAARLSHSPFLNANLRTTCVATRVEAGHANNALPQLASAVINCRILPGQPGSEVEAVIRKLAGPDVRVSVLEPPVNSPASPVTPALLSRVEPLVAKYWPGLPVVPTMATGATDGMYTRSAGIPTYGMSGFDMDPDDYRAHGKDERIRIESFYRAAEFWYDFIKGL